MKKYCVKCGKQFDATGREVICPACKVAAAEESKRAAVLRAKRASWTGESVPVRISGRASTLIRKYGEEKSLPFAAALDALLQSTQFFVSLDTDWSAVVPYKSRRMKKGEQEAQDAPQEVKTAQDVQAAKIVKPVKEVKTAGKATKTSKTSKK